MTVYLTISLIFMAITHLLDRKALRIQWDNVSKFVSWMLILSLVRLALMSYTGTYTKIPQVISYAGFWMLTMVWWEDAFFGLFIFLLMKTKLYKSFKILFILFISIIFAIGHLYQGIWVALFISIYPYFISYKYGKKYGFGTVMLCHIIFDTITLITIKLAPYILQ